MYKMSTVPENNHSQFNIDPECLKLVHKVGSGCTAEVYLGTYGESTVAIKQIHWKAEKPDAKRKAQRAFNRELDIIQHINHENVVHFYGICVQEHRFMVVTEFCSGGCLFELLHNSDLFDLSWPQKGKMIHDCALAMEYLHSSIHGKPTVIHRDLKSLNILLLEPVMTLTDVPRCKITDFGLSRITSDGSQDFGTMTSAVGTCHWMAPEVLQSNHYDQKADVYSFGMIMFEIICREIPFEEYEPAQVRQMIQHGKRPDEDAIPPDCPQNLVDLMQRAWAQDPNQRPGFDKIVVDLAPMLPQLEAIAARPRFDQYEYNPNNAQIDLQNKQIENAQY